MYESKGKICETLQSCYVQSKAQTITLAIKELWNVDLNKID